LLWSRSKLLVRPAWLCGAKRWLRTGADGRETRGAVAFRILHVPVLHELPSQVSQHRGAALFACLPETFITLAIGGARNHFDLFLIAKYRKYRARNIRLDHLAPMLAR